jgi:hypothetical protein
VKEKILQTFAQKALNFFETLENNFTLPNQVQTIFPFQHPENQRVMRLFFEKYYGDSYGRAFLFGINPGRFGAGTTGIGFTDANTLEKICHIPNSFTNRYELSATFIYEVIEAYGGVASFYRDFYMTTTMPIGLLKDGKNYNYYDDKELHASLDAFMVESIGKQLDFGQRSRKIVAIGQSQNYEYLTQVNEAYDFFDAIYAVPHPRWVMQYQPENKTKYIDVYLEALHQALY